MRPALTILKSFPFKTGVIAGFLCFVLVRSDPFALGLGFGKNSVKEAEFYPLSSFPMYSKFSDSPIYVYVTDTKDEPIACQARLGVLASELKKKYDRELRVVGKREGISLSDLSPELKREAGMKTLEDMLGQEWIADLGRGSLRLYEVVLRRGEGDEITKTTTLVGEL